MKYSIDSKREDVNTYFNMLEEIVNKLNEKGLNEKGLKVSLKRKSNYRGKRYNHVISNSENQNLVKFFPFFLMLEYDSFRYIQINVYNKKAFKCIKEVVNNYIEKYNYLEKIRIKIK